jgi:ribonuclease III family protein
VQTDAEELSGSATPGELPNPSALSPLSCAMLSDPQLQQLSPVALAYLGDAVYELYIRRYFLIPSKRIQAYHQQVVAQVRAETQALQLKTLSAYLTPEELNLVKRGRNAASGRPKRIDAETYQQATGLETLVGYLYLTDPQRLFFLLAQLSLEG